MSQLSSWVGKNTRIPHGAAHTRAADRGVIIHVTPTTNMLTIQGVRVPIAVYGTWVNLAPSNGVNTVARGGKKEKPHTWRRSASAEANTA